MEQCLISLVDDKPYNLQVLAEKLGSKPGVTILNTAHDGLEYIRQIESMTPRPQLVFMDIDMPGLDGIETVRRSKAMFPEIHYVMITVFDDVERVFEAIRAGAGGY